MNYKKSEACNHLTKKYKACFHDIKFVHQNDWLSQIASIYERSSAINKSD